MSFLAKIPENIELLQKELRTLGFELAQSYGHECDCEFCDRQGEDEDADEITRIQKEIHTRKSMIKRLKNYQELWERTLTK